MTNHDPCELCGQAIANRECCVPFWRHEQSVVSAPPFQQLAIADITLLSARGRGGQWTLRLLASERSKIARAHDILTERL